MPESRSRRKRSARPKRAALSNPFAATWPLAFLRVQREDNDAMAHVQIARKAPSGYVLAGFLIDFWGLGLKDAYGWDGLSQARLEKLATRVEVPWEDCSLELAQELVYGGLRWANKLGLSLPLDVPIFLPILPKPRTPPPLDRFGYEGGKPLFVGDLDDIARRLPQSTLKRTAASDGLDRPEP